MSSAVDSHPISVEDGVHSHPSGIGADGRDLGADAEMEAAAEGCATIEVTEHSVSSDSAQTLPLNTNPAALLKSINPGMADTEYISNVIAKLDARHQEVYAPGASKSLPVDPTPAQHAHPSIRVHGVHGLDPATTSRADIEARLEAIDQARKIEKRKAEGRAAVATTPTQDGEAADEAILRILALRKLQLLQQHLKTDNQPVLVLRATETHGNLYLGSVGASHHLPNLLAHNITHILSVGRNLSQPFPDHFTYLYIPMLDSSTTRITDDVYETSWQFMEKGRRTGGKTRHHQHHQHHNNNSSQHSKLQLGNEQPASAVSERKSQSPLSVAARSSASLSHPSHTVSSLARTERDEGSVLSSTVSVARASSDSANSNSSPSSPSSPRGNVLVHCFAGKSRSTTILLSYLMYAQKWSLEESYTHVKKCRPSVNPNPGFLLQLKELEKKLQTIANTHHIHSETPLSDFAATHPITVADAAAATEAENAKRYSTHIPVTTTSTTVHPSSTIASTASLLNSTSASVDQVQAAAAAASAHQC